MKNEFTLDPTQTNKDDSDPILEYKNIDTALIEAQKVKLGKIPFYRVTSTDLVAHSIHRLDAMREKKAKSTGRFGPQVVLPFDPYRYTWVRFRKRMLKMANSSFINLPKPLLKLFSISTIFTPSFAN